MHQSCRKGCRRSFKVAHWLILSKQHHFLRIGCMGLATGYGTAEDNLKNDLLLFNNNKIRTSTCVATSVDAKLIYSFVRDRSAYMCELGLVLAIT